MRISELENKLEHAKNNLKREFDKIEKSVKQLRESILNNEKNSILVFEKEVQKLTEKDMKSDYLYSKLQRENEENYSNKMREIEKKTAKFEKDKINLENNFSFNTNKNQEDKIVLENEIQKLERILEKYNKEKNEFKNNFDKENEQIEQSIILISKNMLSEFENKNKILLGLGFDSIAEIENFLVNQNYNPSFLNKLFDRFTKPHNYILNGLKYEIISKNQKNLDEKQKLSDVYNRKFGYLELDIRKAEKELSFCKKAYDNISKDDIKILNEYEKETKNINKQINSAKEELEYMKNNREKMVEVTLSQYKQYKAKKMKEDFLFTKPFKKIEDQINELQKLKQKLNSGIDKINNSLSKVQRARRKVNSYHNISISRRDENSIDDLINFQLGIMYLNMQSIDNIDNIKEFNTPDLSSINNINIPDVSVPNISIPDIESSLKTLDSIDNIRIDTPSDSYSSRSSHGYGGNSSSDDYSSRSSSDYSSGGSSDYGGGGFD